LGIIVLSFSLRYNLHRLEVVDSVQRNAIAIAAFLSFALQQTLAADQPPARVLAKATFRVIDPHGSTGTIAVAINAGGEIAGYYFDNRSHTRGFVRADTGKISTFTIHGAGVSEPVGINAAGTITGFYCGIPCGARHGFLRASNGAITTFDPAGSLQIFVNGINDSGTVAGMFLDNTGAHGFVRTADGTITPYDPPGPINSSIPGGISADGSVTGTYNGPQETGPGFVRAPDGAMTTIVVGYNTLPSAINAQDVIAGSFAVGANDVPGFIRRPDGSVHKFKGPQRSTCITVGGIDDAGDIAGTYCDGKGANHGFVRAADGTVTGFDPHGSIGTYANGINADGLIVGYYADSGNTPHGYLRTPSN
jgi:hypothetical protein